MKYVYFFAFLLLEQIAYAGETVKIPEKGLTLWQMIVNGGVVMIVLGILSIISLSLVLFFFYVLNMKYFMPPGLANDISKALETGNMEKIKILTKDKSTLIQKAVYEGILSVENRTGDFRKKMEERAAVDIEAFWQKIGFLSDIAVVSPMLGLLGTVIGMIKAFNAIAFNIGAVKPIYMAYGVSQAMITTAAGLIVGIFSMIFYFYFRAKLHTIAIAIGDFLEESADKIEKSFKS